ncbi:hypothetical protein [uncultured Pseudonocardia sp.]|uniref:hypothetical protein n=1 Tax=uncultured Pseudonocardia sp. TaxID=211455 RepID=UPI002619C920|nr:hypothetical protein [uncultured Pseudonocardia sp.]
MAQIVLCAASANGSRAARWPSVVKDVGHDDGVIVVVEGPSAAGKTAWCRRHLPTFVHEYAPTGSEPDGTNPAVQAAYWVAVNSRRWDQARLLEGEIGVAVCDGDPLKLHYSWCLSRVGAAPPARFDHELAQVRRAFAESALGLADLVLVSIPTVETLRSRRDADPTRRRRSFDLHARLGEHLRAWYEAVDALDPGRVIWDLPPGGLPAAMPRPRTTRSDVGVLDELIASLPTSP